MELNEKERQPCEVWTRCMGYHRPVSEYNRGKKAEYYERVCFTEKKAVERISREDNLHQDKAGQCAAE